MGIDGREAVTVGGEPKRGLSISGADLPFDLIEHIVGGPVKRTLLCLKREGGGEDKGKKCDKRMFHINRMF